MNNRGNIGRRRPLVGLLFLAAACLLVLSVAVMYWIGLLALEGARDLATHRSILHRFDVFLSALTDAETGERGYLLTGQEQYLEQYEKAVAEIQAQLEGLRHLASTGDLREEDVDRVARLTKQKLAETAEKIELRRNKGLEAALAMVQSNRGKQLMDDIRRQVAGFEAEEGSEFDQAAVRAEQATRLRTAMFTLTICLNLAFLAWVYRRVTEEMGRREAAVLETRRAGEAALRAKEEWERTFDSVPDAITLLDEDHRILRVNRAMAERLHCRAEDCVGQHCYQGVHGTDCPPAFCPHVLTLRDGQAHTLEVHEERLGGDFLVTTTPLRDAQGRVFGTVHVARDITERKRAERALERAAEELARSNKDLEQFAYVASHDLQEPLRMVAGYLQLLRERYRSRLDEKADKYIDYAVDGAERMSGLIRDLLTLSRVNTSGEQIGHAASAEAFELAMRNVQSAIRESGAVVTHDPLPVVRACKAQLVQLFQNLIANAIKFRAPDRPPQIHVSARSEQGHWLFGVQDNGIGFEQEYAERIFLIFQRLHGRAEYPGTGIGLAICKRIVERHGGEIWATSEPDKGSTFFFTVPQ